jgi:hypothetical protein
MWHGDLAGATDHCGLLRSDNETSGFIKDDIFIGSLSDCYFLKKDPAKWVTVSFRYIYDEGKGKDFTIIN